MGQFAQQDMACLAWGLQSRVTRRWISLVRRVPCAHRSSSRRCVVACGLRWHDGLCLIVPESSCMLRLRRRRAHLYDDLHMWLALLVIRKRHA
jgi:hypothetical protein